MLTALSSQLPHAIGKGREKNHATSTMAEEEEVRRWVRDETNLLYILSEKLLLGLLPHY